MPYVVVKDTNVCPADKPWAVKNKNTGDLRGCHPSKQKARQQQMALYVHVEDSEMRNILIPIKQFAETGLPVDEEGLLWLQAYPYKSWSHPLYTDTTVDMDIAQQMVKNFVEGVYGQEVPTDYEHGLDPAKGKKASGWVRRVEAKEDGLYYGVEFTETAKQEISAGEWKYFSAEHWDTWTDPSTNESFEYVLSGGGLTNKPWIKGMVPLNFSEVVVEDQKQFAVWSTAFVNDLPDSCFLYVEGGGKKDSEGKTTPRSLRHLPYKDSGGKIDLPHLRNAIARIPQMKGISSSLKATLQAKARNLLSKHGGKSMAEGVADETGNEETPITGEEHVEVVDESKEMEHSEPGSGSPPTPRTDEDGSDDKAIKEGWRRDQPPIVKELEGSVELDARLREVLGLGEDADILKAVTDIKAEVEPLREAAKTHAEKKAFAESYPDEFARLQRLEKKDRENEAKAFSERFAKFDESEKGFSTVVQDKLQEVHKKFSEGEATTADLAEVMELIASDKGIVDYSETGSSRSTESVNSDPAKAFSEKVIEIQESDKLEYGAAVQEAMRRYPNLFAGYRSNVPTRQEGY
jgi:hypothetical protein